MIDFDRLERRLEVVRPRVIEGRVRSLVGLAVRASIPGVRAGELVEIVRRDGPVLRAEVVGFHEEEAVLMPLGDVAGVGPDDPVRPSGAPLSIRCGKGLLGRVLSGLGEPIDDKGAFTDVEPWSVERPPPDPLRRARVTKPLSTGIRAIDGVLTLGQGQRVGLFAGSGVGKSTLLGQIARQTEADVNVIGLIGERGREVRDFLEESLGDAGLSRSVVVCATSDAPALVRLEAGFVATSIAEYFREQGLSVMLLVDSITRFARAQREVGLAAGEPPTRRGFPPSVFAILPRLLERSGNAEKGSITALYTVLVEGGDMDEPVSDEVRGILDGHIVLSRALAERGHFPAIDVLASLSRVMDAIVPSEQRGAAQRLRELLGAYEQARELVLLGAYKKGSDPRTDEALGRLPEIETFLRQSRDERSDPAKTREELVRRFGA